MDALPTWAFWIIFAAVAGIALLGLGVVPVTVSEEEDVFAGGFGDAEG